MFSYLVDGRGVRGHYIELTVKTDNLLFLTDISEKLIEPYAEDQSEHDGDELDVIAFTFDSSFVDQEWVLRGKQWVSYEDHYSLVEADAIFISRYVRPQEIQIPRLGTAVRFGALEDATVALYRRKGKWSPLCPKQRYERHNKNYPLWGTLLLDNEFRSLNVAIDEMMYQEKGNDTRLPGYMKRRG